MTVGPTRLVSMMVKSPAGEAHVMHVEHVLAERETCFAGMVRKIPRRVVCTCGWSSDTLRSRAALRSASGDHRAKVWGRR